MSTQRRSPPRALRPVVAGAGSLALALGTLWACADTFAPSPPTPPTAAGARASVSGAGCGVSFTAVVVNDDAVLASYGVPPTTDTVHVCETWTGADYEMRETVVGRAYNALVDPGPAQTVVYGSGQVNAYGADGAAVHGAAATDPTSFDIMQVDDATRQASFDDPYWAVYGRGGGTGCGTAIVCSTASAEGQRGGAAKDDTAKAERKYRKHGLKRRGTRALVEDADEVGRDAEGRRRFRKRRGDTDVVVTLDKDTELLVAEEATGPRGVRRTKHAWKADGRGGYYRERSETEFEEVIHGQVERSRTTTTLIEFAAGDAVPAPTPAPTRQRTP